ncbi:hypothetical protein L7F22_033079 [Adiantum nelumboides]|nr:hypothetical protein [Adiantum nelumboides]
MEEGSQSTVHDLGTVVGLATQSQPAVKAKGRYVELDTKLLENWMANHEVRRERPLPWVPLCRLYGHKAVRLTRGNNIEDLARKFTQMGYMQTLGDFIVSEQMPNGDIIQVSEQEEKQWDESFWGEVNRQFDQELSASQTWAHLRGRKLVVWDGNHRLKAWTREINSACYDDATKYVRVKCTVTSFADDEECSMLFALDCLNNLMQTHIKRTPASEIHLLRRLALGNEKSWKKYFDEGTLKEIEVEFSEDKKGHPWIWWTIPLGLLMQLIYSCKKVFVLDRILNKNLGREWGFDGGDKDWRSYIFYYSYWECAVDRAIDLAKEADEIPKLTPGLQREKMPFLEKTAIRFTYRWFAELLRNKHIQGIPSSVEEWKVVSSLGYKSFYPREWLDANRALPKDLYDVPWFLEYPERTYQDEEAAIYKSESNVILRHMCDPIQDTTPDTRDRDSGKDTRGSQSKDTKAHAKLGTRGGKGTLKEPMQSPSQKGKGTNEKKRGSALQSKHGKGKKMVPPPKKRKGNTIQMQQVEEDVDIQEAFVPFHLPICADILQIAADIVEDGPTDCDAQMIRRFIEKLQHQSGFYDDPIVSLVWVDPPSGLHPFEEHNAVPAWNVWDYEKLRASVILASEFSSDEGFFVTTSGIEHQFEIISCVMNESKLVHVHSMFLKTTTRCTRIVLGKKEEVSTLVITFFARVEGTRDLNREQAMLKVMKGSFDTKSDTFVELPVAGKLSLTLDEDGNALRGVAERHTNFCQFLALLCTEEGEIVIDCFAGVGNMAKICEISDCFCISIENDEQCHGCSLSEIGDLLEV